MGHPHGITSSGLNNTSVEFENNTYTISNGTQKGNNLFHSFEKFNLHSGEKAIFNDFGIENTKIQLEGSNPARRT